MTISIATFFVLYNFSNSQEQNWNFHNKERLRIFSDSTIHSITLQYKELHGPLYGQSSMMLNRLNVNQNDFYNFLEDIRFDERFSDYVQGIGYEKITYDKDEFEYDIATLRSSGLLIRDPPSVHPDGRYEYIFFLYPHDERNLHAIGYDMSSEEIRSASLETAKNSKNITSTPPLILVQEITEKKQLGMLIYLVDFDQEGKLLGYHYLAIRLGDFMTKVIPYPPNGVKFWIVDVTDNSNLILFSDDYYHSQNMEMMHFDVNALHYDYSKEFSINNRNYVFYALDTQTYPFNQNIHVVLISLPLVIFCILFVSINSRNNNQSALRKIKDDESKIKNELAGFIEYKKNSDNFLKKISHEIRTPLTPISGWVQYLLETPLNDNQKNAIDRILESLKDIQLETENMTSLFKKNSGTLKIKSEKIFPSQIINNVLFNYKKIISNKNITTKNNIPDNVSCIGDSVKLSQIIRNLVSNSIDFVKKDDGRITFSAEWDTDYLKIIISDNGSGMDNATVKKVFDEEYSDTTNRTIGGSGLGLKICKELSELMQGKFELVSNPGKGTVVIISLPKQSDVTRDLKSDA